MLYGLTPAHTFYFLYYVVPYIVCNIFGIEQSDKQHIPGHLAGVVHSSHCLINGLTLVLYIRHHNLNNNSAVTHVSFLAQN